MSARFVNIDHDTPLLLPPDLRDWVSPDHMVHFIMDAVKALDLSRARTNQRGTGHAQYPPSMMLGLLIYCYATGTFASRRIETLTFENVAVSFLTGDTHPDHDSICKFRRENKDLLADAFHQVLELAARTRILQVGDITVAIDGTKILANDKQQLAPVMGTISPAIIQVSKVLADSGYYSEAAVETIESGDNKPTVYAAMKRLPHGRSIAQIEERADPPPPPENATMAERMAHRLDTAKGKQLYGLRKQTVEPVFGIIKQAIGFRRFLLRGQEKVNLEWTLVTLLCLVRNFFKPLQGIRKLKPKVPVVR